MPCSMPASKHFNATLRIRKNMPVCDGQNVGYIAFVKSYCTKG